jgi:hypothetical protein
VNAFEADNNELDEQQRTGEPKWSRVASFLTPSWCFRCTPFRLIRRGPLPQAFPLLRTTENAEQRNRVIFDAETQRERRGAEDGGTPLS